MEVASFNGTLKVIIYMVAFYYIFKFLARIFFPIMMKKAVEKAAENFDQQQRNYQSGNYQAPRQQSNNDPIYKASKSDKPRETKKIGEYVDYEEID